MEYSEDETSAGVGCASPLTGGSVQADSITGTVLRDEHNGTATGQNQAQGTSSHEVLVEWYNASLLDTTVSDRSEGDLVEELEGGTTGLGTYLIDLEVQVQSGGGAGCTYTDDGEEIAYRGTARPQLPDRRCRVHELDQATTASSLLKSMSPLHLSSDDVHDAVEVLIGQVPPS